MTDIDNLRALADRLDAHAQHREETLNTWQPIATAPDLTPVLVYCPDPVAPFQMIGVQFQSGCWADAYEGFEIYPPSNWMPLPTPPETPEP